MNQSPEDRLQSAFEAARTAAAPFPTDNQRTHARAQFILEIQAVSSDEVMRHREQVSALPDLSVTQGEQPMQRFYTRHLRLAAAALIGVIIAGGFWASPSLRALAQEVLAFFTNESSDAQITVQPLDSGVRAAQASANFYSQSIHDVADQIDFTLRVPTTIPGNYQFAGAEYRPDQGLAALRYECDLGFSFVLTEQLSDTPHTPDEVGASAVIEDVPIRETIGQYVRGAWMAVLDEITTTEADKQNNTVTVPRVWTNESDWQQMYWREAGINFMIASGGAGDSITQTPCALTKADYAAIAQGLELMQP